MQHFISISKSDNQKLPAFISRKKNSSPFFKPVIQPKLTINNPNDAYEQEADAMADKVMRMEQPGVQLKPLSITAVQRKCEHCEEEEKQMQRKEKEGEEIGADDNLENYVSSLSSSGQPLPNEVRNFYEPRFGYDFSNVKVHTGSVASKSAQSINALAYTSGNNIVFNDGQYSPNTDSRRRLLAHELSHTLQQGTSIKKYSKQKLQQQVLNPDTRIADVIQRAMKFELQTENIIWRTNAKTSSKLPRKFGPDDFLVKGTKGKPAKGGKEGTAIELQSEHGGFVEFETPKWFRNWCELKERIQEAVDMTDKISKSKIVSTTGGINTVEFPFDIKRLKQTKAFPSGLKTGESLQVEILDPDWKAKIQASEAIELPQYESLLREHEKPARVTSTLSGAQNILNTANTAKLPASGLANLLGFLQIIVNYINRGQDVDLSNPGLPEGDPAKFAFRLMFRTSFSSVYDSLLSKDEKKIFKEIITKDIILNELGLDRKTKFFKHGHGTKRLAGPAIYDWLISIMGSGKDLLSPLKEGSAAMGKFDVVTKAGEKDTNLVKFEARGSSTHGTGSGGMVKPAKDWVSFIETIFKQAFTNRNRTGSTELKYDPAKCP